MIFQDNVLDTCATLEGVTLNDEDIVVEMPEQDARSHRGTAAGEIGEQGVRGQDQRRSAAADGQENGAGFEGAMYPSSQGVRASGNRQRASIDSCLVAEEPSPLSSAGGRSHSNSGQSSQGRQPSVDSLIIQGGVSPISQRPRGHENV